MRRTYPSLEAAREAFDVYAGLEPRLVALWERCLHPTRPVPEPDVDEDVYDCDPLTDDDLPGTLDDTWCAEDFFDQQVKPRLMSLVGLYRRDEGVPELHSQEAYETVHDLLRYRALDHSTCCDVRKTADAQGIDGGRPSQW